MRGSPELRHHDHRNDDARPYEHGAGLMTVGGHHHKSSEASQGRGASESCRACSAIRIASDRFTNRPLSVMNPCSWSTGQFASPTNSETALMTWWWRAGFGSA